MTSDNFDLVPGGAGHDGLTNPPQQGEEAWGIQQHQPAQSPESAVSNLALRSYICNEKSRYQQGTCTALCNNLAGLLHVSWRLCLVLSSFALVMQKEALYSQRFFLFCTQDMAHRGSIPLANQLTVQVMACLAGKMCSTQLGSHIMCCHHTHTHTHKSQAWKHCDTENQLA